MRASSVELSCRNHACRTTVEQGRPSKIEAKNVSIKRNTNGPKQQEVPRRKKGSSMSVPSNPFTDARITEPYVLLRPGKSREGEGRKKSSNTECWAKRKSGLGNLRTLLVFGFGLFSGCVDLPF